MYMHTRLISRYVGEILCALFKPWVEIAPSRRHIEKNCDSTY